MICSSDTSIIPYRGIIEFWNEELLKSYIRRNHYPSFKEDHIVLDGVIRVIHGLFLDGIQ